jgi:hypothetical protein
MNNGKALQPLTYGTVLIVGAKASNFGDEIKTHPRVTIWDSQNENWTDRSLPDNTRAVFMTRFISHSASSRIITEARKKQITIFTPDGTGIIARQVKELLNMTPKSEKELTIMETAEEMVIVKGKLEPLYEFIDFSKNNIENARALMLKAKELGITTTEASLSQLVGNRRKKGHHTAVPRSLQGKLDVSVEILDSAVQAMKDIRDFLISTTEENRKLKEKVEKFKKLFDEM